VVLGLSLNGPVHNLSDGYLFSAHMVQHLVLTLVFPPLLLYGTPAWVVRPLLRPRWVHGFARWATRPLAAGVLFSAPITLWHFPQFYEAALEHHPLHIVQHLVFLATGGLVMWVGGTIYLWVAATVVWFRWSAREESGDVETAVPVEAYGSAGCGVRSAESTERAPKRHAT